MMTRGVCGVSLALVIAASACTTDAPKPDDAGDLAAAEPVLAVLTDAGTPVAPAEPVPTVETLVDAGHVGDAPAPVVATPDAVTPDPVNTPLAPVAKVDPIQVTIFNRLIVRPLEKGLTMQQVQEIAENATGQKVETIRRTAGVFWLLQFAPTTPPRTKADQQQLIADLKAKTQAFKSVEGDQVMTIR
jgi:hypothetical protein